MPQWTTEPSGTWKRRVGRTWMSYNIIMILLTLLISTESWLVKENFLKIDIQADGIFVYIISQWSNVELPLKITKCCSSLNSRNSLPFFKLSLRDICNIQCSLLNRNSMHWKQHISWRSWHSTLASGKICCRDTQCWALSPEMLWTCMEIIFTLLLFCLWNSIIYGKIIKSSTVE